MTISAHRQVQQHSHKHTISISDLGNCNSDFLQIKGDCYIHCIAWVGIMHWFTQYINAKADLNIKKKRGIRKKSKRNSIRGSRKRARLEKGGNTSSSPCLL